MSDGAQNDAGEPVDAPGEASLLVSEFPPPPFYYRFFGTKGFDLKPPPIPQEKLTYATEQATKLALQQVEKEEKLRQGLVDDPQAFLTGMNEEVPNVDDDKVVGVFGEVVEDPLLLEPLHKCEEDPIVNCKELKRLNMEVLDNFVKLVSDLVHRPLENKESRDSLSHNVHLMLLECNKFREHQARQVLIELLEQQLDERNSLTKQLEETVVFADDVLQL